MREIDHNTTERCGTPSLVLMENAALATAQAVSAQGGVRDKSILVLCGPGNNGGDGAATARLLALAGATVDIVLLGEVKKTKGDARTNFEKVATPAGGVPLRFFECASADEWNSLEGEQLAKPYDSVVDALFGTGLTRPLTGVYGAAVRYLLRLRRLRDEQEPSRPAIISIDIPSGLNADSAHPIGEAVQADVTVAMTAPKPANVLPPPLTTMEN